MNKVIEITIAPNGLTRIVTSGFFGNACREASRSIEQSLGQHCEEQLTSEFYISQRTQTQQHHNQ
ncbi:DUF2997 domain-containing protein [uncultured Rubinisphaera sp.]|uniref:DUF2997 domain-containing protein n=1 Tax=uncultured Rubinisphaera sp. TaxID=1678686 RepID=UPI0030DAF547